MLLESDNVYTTVILFTCFKIWYFIKTHFIGVVSLTNDWFRKINGSSRMFVFQGLRNPPKYAVMTGATQGIGLEVAEHLLHFGLTVTIGALMSKEECFNFKNSLQSKYPDCKLNVWPLNLKSLKTVKVFAEKYLQSEIPLHLLLNHAGVMHVPHEETEDGFEHHMSVNYLSHCLLTKLLLHRLIESGSFGDCSRIINISSSTHYIGDINFQDLQSRKCYSPFFCYSQSKLAIVMFTSALQRYLNAQSCHVTVNSLHPGVVYTNLYKNEFWAPYLGPYLFMNPKEGSQKVLHCALSSELEGVGGKYLEDCRVMHPSFKARDVVAQQELWHRTWKILEPWIEDS